MPESDEPTPIREEPWPEDFANRVLEENEMQKLAVLANEQFGGLAAAFPNYRRGLTSAAEAGITTGSLEPVSFDIDSGDDSLPVVTWRIGTTSRGNEKVFLVYRSNAQPRRIGQLPYSEQELPWAEKFEAVMIPGSDEVIRVSYWNPDRQLNSPNRPQVITPHVNTGAVALGLDSLSSKLGFDIKRQSNSIQPPRR